jgi:hypothetical protein
MDMMREAIEKRASETLATEDGGPFLEWTIRRDDGRATFVTPAEYFIGSVFARLPSAWAKARTCAGLTTTIGGPAPARPAATTASQSAGRAAETMRGFCLHYELRLSDGGVAVSADCSAPSAIAAGNHPSEPHFRYAARR